MRTEDMPTTNQGQEKEKSFADKIPPTMAAGFKKAAETVGNALASSMKKAASGMNQ